MRRMTSGIVISRGSAHAFDAREILKCLDKYKKLHCVVLRVLFRHLDEASSPIDPAVIRAKRTFLMGSCRVAHDRRARPRYLLD